MTTRQELHALLRALRWFSLLAMVPFLALALLDRIALAPSFLAPLAGAAGKWLIVALILASLFWLLAYWIDPYRRGAVPVEALFAKAKRKRQLRRPLSRPERLCYDALSFYNPIKAHGLAQGIDTLGTDRARAKLYILREVYLEKSHVILTKALDRYEAAPKTFAAQADEFETALTEAGFHQLPGRLTTRLEEMLRG
ncbi:hypothetical protein [Shimia aestuarii]|uniref:hypothetical protein n=1 Tax=Shimia aestuarii TaxID=254406 RepID=UPI001FB1D6F2|nr:hypothetical protein [Shimia aestuarii]